MESRKGKTLPNAVLLTYKILIFPHFIEILSDFLHAIFYEFFIVAIKGGKERGRNETVEQKQERKDYQKQIAKKKVFWEKNFFSQKPCYFEN